MESLAFHLFVVGTVIFALCSYDCSRPLLCCRQQSIRLVIWWGFCFLVFWGVFFHLMLAGGQPFEVLRWFQLFCFIHLVSAVCLTIREAIFRLPPVFVVCSFFLCHRHLRSVLSFFATGICVRSLSFMAFSAIGIRVRLSVFALLALVSGYQCISQFLVSCCALAARQLHPWRFELDFFASRLPGLWPALQIPL